MTQQETGAPASPLATVPEAARYLRLSRSKVYEMLDRGELPSVYFGKSRRVPWAALRTLAETGVVPGSGRTA
jgi:excisionase family DNA binding protein